MQKKKEKKFKVSVLDRNESVFESMVWNTTFHTHTHRHTQEWSSNGRGINA